MLDYRPSVERSFSTLALTLVCLIASLSFVSRASAQASKADLERADKLYTEGKAALEAGRIDEACPKLEQSLAIDRGIGTLLNVARCHQQQGKSTRAWREYNEASTVAMAKGDERAAGARELADKLAASLPKIRIVVSSPPPGLAVKRDNEDVPANELGQSIPVDPGSHTITAAAQGFESFSATANASEASTTTVNIEMKPGESSKVTGPSAPIGPSGPTGPSGPAGSKGSKSGPSAVFISGMVIGGVGVVGVVVGAALGVVTMNELSGAEDDPTLCPNKQCTPAGREAVDGAKTKGIISTVGFAVGGAALATGVILIVLDVTGTIGGSSTGESTPNVGLAPGPGDAGLSLLAHF